MGNLSFVLFISIVVPLIMSLLICKGKSRLLLVFLLIGTIVSMICGEIDGLLMRKMLIDSLEFTANVSPLVEELFKATPIIIYAFCFKPDKQTLLECSALIGVGFAIIENAYMIVGNISSITILIAVIRGFGAGLMHVVSTMSVGYGMTFVYNRKKVYFTGTIAVLTAVIMFHSIYNMLVRSEHQLLGFVLPTLTFIPFLLLYKKDETDHNIKKDD